MSLLPLFCWWSFYLSADLGRYLKSLFISHMLQHKAVQLQSVTITTRKKYQILTITRSIFPTVVLYLLIHSCVKCFMFHAIFNIFKFYVHMQSNVTYYIILHCTCSIVFNSYLSFAVPLSENILFSLSFCENLL